MNLYLFDVAVWHVSSAGLLGILLSRYKTVEAAFNHSHCCKPKPLFI